VSEINGVTDQSIFDALEELQSSTDELDRVVRAAVASGEVDMPKPVQLAKRRNRQAWKAFRDLHKARWSGADTDAGDDDA
jgi:hypothetical protein